MAKCKECNVNIPDGTEYCNTCLNKDHKKSNESYLDSLLNSVINTQPTAGEKYVKNNKKNNSEEKSIVQGKPETENTSNILIDNPDIENFDLSQEDINDFSDFNLYEDLDDNIYINDIDIFGEEIEPISKIDIPKKDNPNQSDRKINNTIEDYNVLPDEIKALQDENTMDYSLEDLLRQVDQDGLNKQVGESVVSDKDAHQFEDDNTIKDKEEYVNYKDDYSDQEDVNNKKEVEEIIEASEEKAEASVETAEASVETAEELSSANEVDQEVEDFINLLNQVDVDDRVADDVHAINNLLNEIETPSHDTKNSMSSVGDIFSDALKAVSSLDDPLFDDAILDLIPDLSKTKKTKKNAKVKIKKKSFLQKLFGNVKDEELKKNPTKKAGSKNVVEKSSEAVTSEDVKNSSKKKSKKDGKNKKASNKDLKADDKDSIEDERPNRRKDEGNADKEVNKKLSKEELKKEKKEKKKQAKEVIQVIDESEEDESHINRVGASIVFILFGIIATVLIIGTNIFSYSLSIKNATNYFERQKYTQAYNEVYGIEIKDEDIEIYDKIMTVMFVNKQLNSYNNFYSIEKYPEALDSLLKGLGRYDKYIELATMLGIKTDLDYVRNQIITELNNVFNITEEEAFQIINSESQAKYSVQVYDVVIEKMNN